MRRARRAAAWAAVALLAATPGAGAETIAGPRLDYVLQCRGCHGADGRGAPDRVPDLAGMARFLRVPGGRAYLVRVPGVAHALLDDAAVAALLNWTLARFAGDDLPADFQPYTAAEVARLRAEPLLDADAERRALLAALDAPDPPAPGPNGD